MGEAHWCSDGHYVSYVQSSVVYIRNTLRHGTGQSEGPEPVSHGSSDPMSEPVSRARSKLECLVGVPAPPGANMVAPSEVPRNAEGAQSEGRAENEILQGIHRQQRGHYRN